MTINRFSSTYPATAPITFENLGGRSAVSGVNYIDASKIHCFVEIVSLDINGDPITPVTGSYTIRYKLSEFGGWQLAGTIPAGETGGTSLGTDLATVTAFQASTYELDITPNSIDTGSVIQYNVTLIQSNT